MPLAAEQVQVRDLVMGPGTPYEIVRGFNPFDRSVRADQGGERAWNHGSWSGVEWQAEAVIPIYVEILPAVSLAAWMTARSNLAAAFRPVGESTTDVELRFELGGDEYLLYGRPRMIEHDLTTLYGRDTIQQCAFVALDPFIYAGVETVAGPIGLPGFVGGLTLPLTVPFSIDATAVGGTVELTNEGTADTGLLLRIDGPVSEPVVSLLRDDGVVQTLRFALTVEDGHYLEVDTEARTVLYDGTDSRRGQTSGDFPILPAGTHTLRWVADDDNDDATLTATFRSRWW